MEVIRIDRIYKIPVLIILHVILGKKAAFPYGVASGMSTIEVAIYVILIDFAQIPGYRYIFDGAGEKFRLFRWIHGKLDKLEDKFAHKRIYQWFTHLGHLGVFLLTVIPGAGAIQTGSALSHFLKIPKSRSYPILGVGAIIGCLIFVGGVEWILHILNL